MMITTDTPSMDRRSLLRGSVTVAGAAIILPSLASLGGCSSMPASLTEKMDLISAISDRIIPATDTGGALAAKVPEYIAALFEKHFSEDQQSAFAMGLDAIGDAGFAAASPEQQDDILSGLASADDADAGKATFQQLRDMTIFGFYTSEVATEELSYEELPGRYDGCVPLSEVGRAWLDRGV
ncbi:gluconate 2-dehydrogenase subunit 3 family protein [uncultured Erythrobacter sp.]|uniref:gluconate 2-dehydrogenase subunit 3 family protein n=1 Tax=uncultured Erythrobacter sp. TaxID=263913 RepID=UPI00260F2409|nr:gluconate 2-dehydrogenase subunit 3 family protein [uncultured Erythrobacter sp.]